MEKIKLSTLLSEYEAKFARKDEKYGFYFEEQSIERKVTKLRLFDKTLGDVSFKEDYFKAILYYGQTEISEQEICWIGGILSSYEDIPDDFISTILLCYDRGVFSKYPVREYFDSLILKFGMTEETFKQFSKYLEEKKFELKVLDSKYALELISLSKEYGVKFADTIFGLVTQKRIELSEVFELLPSKEFVDNSKVTISLGYEVITAEDLVVRTLLGYVDIDKFSDDDYITLGSCSDGSSVYTTFTKKQYLEEIEKSKQK